MAAIGIVLLAAGGSTRMGRPKQLLPFAGTTLLRHAAGRALKTRLSPVVVVLGSEAELCRAEIADLGVTIAVHHGWREGMGSSLRVGQETLEKASPDVEAVLILLHDQPLISPGGLRELVDLWQPPHYLIACAEYGGTLGVPAVFDRRLFSELKSLPAKGGAKEVLLRHAGRAARLRLPAAADDIDSPEDYARLSQRDIVP